MLFPNKWAYVKVKTVLPTLNFFLSLTFVNLNFKSFVNTTFLELGVNSCIGCMQLKILTKFCEYRYGDFLGKLRLEFKTEYKKLF